ncbi:DUF4255 domain-containing protein [uncultured Methanomethylovorans sp.]|uniref:DUF4255 domain-containing protein n=1 Tax=uncultured Methanomethylovorans sp. TaxID=183759 RepID=UPI00260EA89A|nr:DUF4255 domain-containing protein [uncultured Methanomethylovorans sp.]
MSDHRAIADVGETLIELLKDNMKDLIPADSIILASPGEIDSKDNVRLSLFLYQILENAHLKNQEMQVPDPAKVMFPPQILELYYMLTSHVSSGEQDKTEKALEEHRVLGRALQVLHDNSILSGSLLKGSLDRSDELHIALTSPTLDDLTKIWTTFAGRPFRPSVCYVVTPVRIDSTRTMSVQRVITKEMDYMQMVKKKESQQEG